MKRLGLVFIACCLLASCHQAWAQPRAATSFTIKAKELDVRSLLSVASDMVDVELIIGDELLDRRLDIDQSHINLIALIERLVAEQHLAVKRSGNALLIASSCRLARSPDIPVFSSDKEIVTFNFQRVPVESVVGAEGILHDEAQLPFDSTDVDGTEGLTVKYLNGAIRDELMAIATVQGWDVGTGATGGIKITRNEIVEQCQENAGNHRGETAQFAPPSAPPTCPGPAATQRCGILERYELSKIIARGWIKSDRSDKQGAFVELPPRALFLVKAGDYMGRNNGKIVKISNEGIEMEERRQGSNGRWETWRFVLPYR